MNSKIKELTLTWDHLLRSIERLQGILDIMINHINLEDPSHLQILSNTLIAAEKSMLTNLCEAHELVIKNIENDGYPQEEKEKK